MTFGWHHRAWHRDRSGPGHRDRSGPGHRDRSGPGHRDRSGPGRHDRSSLLDETRLAEMIALTERIIAIRPDQRDAWDSLVGAMVAGAGAVRHASQLSDGEDSAPARLARLEICFTAGLEALRRLYPALAALYDRLDDRQKEILDLLATPAGHDDGHFAHQAAG